MSSNKCFLCENIIGKNAKKYQIATVAAGQILSLVITHRGVEVSQVSFKNELLM